MGSAKKHVWEGAPQKNLKTFRWWKVERKNKRLERKPKTISKRNLGTITRKLPFFVCSKFSGFKRRYHNLSCFFADWENMNSTKIVLNSTLVSAKRGKTFASAFRNFPALCCFVMFGKVFATF